MERRGTAPASPVVHSTLAALRPVRVDPVAREEGPAWNAMMADYHPPGIPHPAAGEAPPASAAQQKQDCEVKAFQRLAARIKRAFRRRRLLVLADGLYANGPIMALCRQHSWDFLLVLRDDGLPAFWKEVNTLHRLAPEQICHRERGGRQLALLVGQRHTI